MGLSPFSFLAWCARIVALVAAACVLTSCRAVNFYTQAARGQWQIMRGARPIPEVMKECFGESQQLKERLALVQELRQFAAEELMLPADSQYDRYCDLGRKYVVWVVFAAPEFSVEAMTWWYPLVGSLKYRGFFNEAEAKREADRLRRRGCDVYVTGTEAYSTLGWLRDPVLNTFLSRSDALLAELIFHELTHQRLYLAGDTDFNEAFATAVGEEGARRWLRSKGRMAELKSYEAQKHLQREIVAAVLRTRAKLNEVYHQNSGTSVDRLRALKTIELTRLRTASEELRRQHGVRNPVKGAPSKLLNNASLNSVAAYYTLLPGFERMLKAERGGLGPFFRRVEAMKGMSKSERRDVLLTPD